MALAILLMIFAGGGLARAGECTAPEGFPNPRLLETMQRGVNLPGWDHPDPERSSAPVLPFVRIGPAPSRGRWHLEDVQLFFGGREELQETRPA